VSTRGMYTRAPRSTVGAIINASAAVTEAERARSSIEEQLATLQLAFAEVYRELYEAAQMQRQMSGPRMLRHADFEIAAEIFPVRHLSGDFFSVSEQGTSTLLAIGDIAGKGVLAGMWFTHLLGLTRIYGETVPELAEAMSDINHQICASATSPPLTSMVLARLDRPTGELLYCNAGHPAPVLLRADGEVEFLNVGGLVLGAVEEARFRSARVILEPGDTLLGFSDGLLECCNEHDEQFGVERVIDEARRAVSLETPTSMLCSIIGAAQDFAGTASRTDDCTMMVVRRRRYTPASSCES
jgi:serine phosphatase RsbU (regulator of sigma subunit)